MVEEGVKNAPDNHRAVQDTFADLHGRVNEEINRVEEYMGIRDAERARISSETRQVAEARQEAIAEVRQAATARQAAEAIPVEVTLKERLTERRLLNHKILKEPLDVRLKMLRYRIEDSGEKLKGLKEGYYQA